MERRRVPPTGVRAPLIVPSFSSHGFLHVGAYFESFVRYTTPSYLVSAYDVFHELLPSDSFTQGDIVILDSGGYEAYASSELSRAAPWDFTSYEGIIAKAEGEPTVLPVSFDYNLRGTPLSGQVSLALELADAHSFRSWDFLVKPVTGGIVPEAREFIPFIDAIARLGVIGFVEDELGQSLVARARRIRDIRSELTNYGLSNPIHLFGCLNPLTIPYYVEAGADMFDGLEWLRGRIDYRGVQRFSDFLALT